MDIKSKVYMKAINPGGIMSSNDEKYKRAPYHEKKQTHIIPMYPHNKGTDQFVYADSLISVFIDTM